MARPTQWTLVSACAVFFLVGRFIHLPGHGPAAQQVPKHDASVDLDAAAIEAAKQQQVEARQPRKLLDAEVAVQQEAVVLPPPAIGFDVAVTRLLQDAPPLQPAETGSVEYLTQPVQQLSMYPRLFLWPNFLSLDKVQRIIDLANSRLAPSQLMLNEDDKEENHANVRTSEGTFLGRHDDEVLAYVEDKIAALTGIPLDHGEFFNVLRYKQGQHYDQHYDYFPEDMYGKMDGNRMATVLLYLSTVEEGGETIFPIEGKHGLEMLNNGTVDYVRCDIGYKYKPRAGDALLFYSTYPSGELDQHSLHGGCPVVKGEKWVMTKWMWNKEYS